jgi:hypothetical protein
MNTNNLLQALSTSLPPHETEFATLVAAALRAHPNLAAWLRSLNAMHRRESYSLLLRAAHVFRTDLPDRIAADVLTRFAAHPELLRAVVIALRGMPAAITAMPVAQTLSCAA